MSKKRRQLILLVGILLLIGMAVGYGIARRPRQRLLLQRAVKVARMEGWNGDNQDYFWASDHEALLYVNVYDSADDLIHVVSHDTTTGAESPLTGLSRRLNSKEPARHNGYWLSPDGNWMLYSDFYADSIKATSRDGSRCLSWHSDRWDSLNGGYWLPDSRHWIQLLFDPSSREATHILVRSIENPQNLQSIEIPASCRTLFMDSDDMSWLSDRHLILEASGTASGEKRSDHAVDFYELDLNSTAPPRKWTVALPEDWILYQVHLSPHADHVGWVFHRSYISPLLTQLQRLGLPIRTTPIQETVVYVSRVDGTEMREIGTAPTPENPSQDVEIAWLPGGKQLCFVYRDLLYTVQAF